MYLLRESCLDIQTVGSPCVFDLLEMTSLAIELPSIGRPAKWLNDADVADQGSRILQERWRNAPGRSSLLASVSVGNCKFIGGIRIEDFSQKQDGGAVEKKLDEDAFVM